MDLSDALQALDDHMHRVESKRYGPVEKRPAPLNRTDTERLEWFAEYCDRYDYIKPGHIITDCDGQKTIAASFRAAIDAAAAKWKEANE
jgi:hypothetical protein